MEQQLADHPPLKRDITGPLLYLFILGDVLGAGVYALVGIIAGEVGGVTWAPMLVALLLALLTAASYAELVTKYPRAGGAAVFAHRAFRVPIVPYLVGFCMLTAGVVSASALALAFSGDYLAVFVDVPPAAGAIVFLVAIALLNARGIKASLRANVVMTALATSPAVDVGANKASAPITTFSVYAVRPVSVREATSFGTVFIAVPILAMLAADVESLRRRVGVLQREALQEGRIQHGRPHAQDRVLLGREVVEQRPRRHVRTPGDLLDRGLGVPHERRVALPLAEVLVRQAGIAVESLGIHHHRHETLHHELVRLADSVAGRLRGAGTRPPSCRCLPDPAPPRTSTRFSNRVTERIIACSSVSRSASSARCSASAAASAAASRSATNSSSRQPP